MEHAVRKIVDVFVRDTLKGSYPVVVSARAVQLKTNLLTRSGTAWIGVFIRQMTSRSRSSSSAKLEGGRRFPKKPGGVARCARTRLREGGYRLDAIERPARHAVAVDRLTGRRHREAIDYSGGELPGRKSMVAASCYLSSTVRTASPVAVIPRRACSSPPSQPPPPTYTVERVGKG